MGLPFGYSNCSRGFGGRPPKCYQWFDIEHPEVTRPPPPPEQDAAAATPAPPPPPRHPLECFHRRSRSRANRAAGTPPAPPKPQQPKRPTTFGEYLRDVGDVVHTGAVRVSANDDNTDFYTVR